MKDLGAASRILGMNIIRDRKKGTLKLSQGKYLQKVLETFNMAESKAVVTPIGPQFKLKSLTQEEEHVEASFMNVIPYASAVGSLLYSMVGSRPGLCFAVGLISRYMSKPGKKHWEAVKWVMRYLKGALDSDLLFTKGEDFMVQGFCDADYATDLDRRRSVTEYVFQDGGNTISWRSGLQHIVALSTTESEYMALAEAFKEALWLKGFVSELGFKQDDVRVFSDSQSARLHFMRDVIEAGDVTVHKIHTSINPADFLT
ncbi:secreted RxLR effector protein 161-like [Brassica napus]|uniref:secreted RxLR effector protein 161-like n=1 Tax=Brassica napus TaxID=3708 RepID=UPI002078C361|nr:secreted RxLR effector protein 161-like [Brassica napus]